MVVCLLIITSLCTLYLIASLDIEAGGILRVASIFVVILAFIFGLKLLIDRIIIDSTLMRHLRHNRIDIEYGEIADIVRKYDLSEFEKTYDNEMSCIVYSVKIKREKKVVYVKWIKDLDKSLIAAYGSKQDKKEVEKDREKNREKELDFKLERSIGGNTDGKSGS